MTVLSVALVKSSTLTETARPPRSTIVKTLRFVAVPRLPCQPLPLTKTSVRLADERLVNLNRLAFAAQRLRITVGHRLANAMRHEPSGAVGAEAKHPHKLMSRDAFLARRHQTERQRPLVQRNMAGLHDGADRDRERLPAGVALIHAGAMRFALNERRLVDHAAMRANRLAIRPTD